MAGLLTLTSDFGTRDAYVAAMKAVILERAPADLRLVDISHDIPPNDIMAGAWVIREAARFFPAGTIHVAVVDPGVGTERDPVLIRSGGQWFIGPDNGLFSLISEDGGGTEAWRLDKPGYWLPMVSRTFHGRDVFAPVAAHLACGVPPDRLGSPHHELKSWRWPEPVQDHDGIRGWVVHIDHFGNLISNIPSGAVGQAAGAGQVKVYVGNTILGRISGTFGDVAEGEAVIYPGSAGFLEVAVNKGSATDALGVPKGSEITIVFQR